MIAKTVSYSSEPVRGRAQNLAPLSPHQVLLFKESTVVKRVAAQPVSLGLHLGSILRSNLTRALPL